MADVPLIFARLDQTLQALVEQLQPLRYRDGGALADDRPGHVRAASAVRVWGQRLVVVQDDVNVLALQGGGTLCEAMLLPAGPGGRRVFGDGAGDKKFKMDLEACITLPDGRLAAFGSGSSPLRERLVVVKPSGEVRVREAGDLYEILHKTTAFSGSELNLEGALVIGDRVRLFQRGNGAPTAELQPVDATGDLPLESFLSWLDRSEAAPQLERIRRYDLGSVGGVRYGFTDAALIPDGRVAFLACAEDSPDALQDGTVLGSRFGVIGRDEARITDIMDETGRPAKLKLEGIEWLEDGQGGSFVVVADMDHPEEPALLGRLRVRGLFIP
ncbi:MAG: hypothetical protein AB1896_11060 [Thermodesulfobacteriota bacterium]